MALKVRFLLCVIITTNVAYELSEEHQHLKISASSNGLPLMLGFWEAEAQGSQFQAQPSRLAT